MLIRFLLVAALLLVAASGTRRGVIALVVASALQDVLRKLDNTPGSGFLWTGLAGLVLVATVTGLILRGERRSFTAGEASRLQKPLVVLAVIVLLQAVVSFARTKSVAVPLLGIAMYLFPLAALQVGLTLGRSARTVDRLLLLYAGVTSIALGAMFFTKLGVQHPLLDPVGEELVTYGVGGVVQLEQGLYRAPEIAGWHASMLLCLCLLWAGEGRRRAWVPLLVVASLAALWTGRRKWLLTPAVVLVTAQVGALWLGLRRTRLLAGGVAALLVLVGVTMAILSTANEHSATGAHLARLNLVEAHAASRVHALGGVGPLDVIKRVGWLGGGVGVAQQGTRHLAGAHGVEIAGWGAEGGLGQILAEIGIPGLLASLVVALMMGRVLLGGIRRAMRVGDDRSAWLLMWGTATLLANALAFLLAKQAFGDPFIVAWLGLLAGCLVARADAVAVAPTPFRAGPRPYRLDVVAPGGIS
ncbi:MAG: hypothetical protein AB7T63_11440 [Planctomycetota bacterium]